MVRAKQRWTPVRYYYSKQSAVTLGICYVTPPNASLILHLIPGRVVPSTPWLGIDGVSPVASYPPAASYSPRDSSVWRQLKCSDPGTIDMQQSATKDMQVYAGKITESNKTKMKDSKNIA